MFSLSPALLAHTSSDIMADDPHNTSDISDTVDVEGAKEDAETTAARRELKQTSISEKGAQHAAQSSQDDKSGSDDDTPADKGPARTPSPQHGVPKLDHHELREQVSSPKKKRAHDEVDESHEEAKDSPKDEESSDPPSTVAVTKSRSDRSEPEKKRPRDRQADEETRNSQDEDVSPTYTFQIVNARLTSWTITGAPISRFVNQIQPRPTTTRCAYLRSTQDVKGSKGGGAQKVNIRLCQQCVRKTRVVNHITLWRLGQFVGIETQFIRGRGGVFWIWRRFHEI